MRLLLCVCWTQVALAANETLPPAVEVALAKAHIPKADVSIFVQDVNAGEPLIALGDQEARNPASTMKLLTTLAGLEMLGPAFRWKTEVYVTGTVHADVLEGNIYIKGYGDPNLTLERFTALLDSVRQQGIREITGDVILDRSHFDIPEDIQQSFDNHPYETYNTPPDALLIALNSVQLKITPNGEKAHKPTVSVSAAPKLPQLQLINELRPVTTTCHGGSIALQATSGHKQHANRQAVKSRGRRHHALSKATYSEHQRHDRQRRRHKLVFVRARPQVHVSGDREHGVVKFSGYYPLGCGETSYVTKVLGPAQFAYGTFVDTWSHLGGTIRGHLQLAAVPQDARKIASVESEPLADIVYAINKQSNNPMARQLFLSLGNHKIPPPATTTKADHAIREWLNNRGLNFSKLVLENGSGLSHMERISANELGHLLLHAYHSDAAQAFLASLPIVSVDGTMKHRLRYQPVAGHAHIKTGSLRGVKAIAGYVNDRQGRTIAVVFIANRPGAGAVVPAQDQLLEWIFERT